MTKQRTIALTILLGVLFILGIAVPIVYGLNQRETQAAGAIERRPTYIPENPARAVPNENLPEPAVVQEREQVITNCTFPIEYWQNQPEQWPAQIAIGGKLYTKEDAFQVFTVPDPDPQTLLVRQVYTALLNILNGANPTAIEETLGQANQWLDDNPREQELSEFTRREGLFTAQILSYYNDGEIGPGPCPETEYLTAYEASSTSTPNPTAFPTARPATQEARSAPILPVNQPPDDEKQDVSPPPTQIVVPQPPAPSPTVPPPTLPVPSPTSIPPTPTTAPPPPAPTAPPGDTAEQQHPRGLAIADEYGVPYDEVMSWASQGYGFGDIDRAYGLSQESGSSVDEIFDMVKQGLSWGEIKKRLSGD